jgi:phosphatidylglycerophosphate synthase
VIPDAPRTEGERWTREELRRLRDARYASDAIRRFLAASTRRAGEVRSARPALARQSNTWLGMGALAWSALAAAGCEPYRRRIVPAIAWWAAVAAMLHWHLGMIETEDGEHVPLGPADALTITRVWLAPALADDLDPRLLVVAAATDVLDGLVARAGRPTRAGRDLEGLADAAVLLAALHAAARTRRLARPVVALEAIRLLAGTAYAAAVYFAQADAPDPVVTRAARGTTPIRVAGLLAAGAGRRRWGHVLLVTGSVASLASLARGVRRRGA